MRNLQAFKLSLALLFSTLGTGCASVAFAPHKVPIGVIYADTSSNEMVTDGKFGAKTGKACATSILGWITLGDASVATAGKIGGITEIASVDHTFKNILGAYAEYCVIVSGE